MTLTLQEIEITYKFPEHATFVAACEQLADDLIDFETNCVELEIKTKTKPTDTWFEEFEHQTQGD